MSNEAARQSASFIVVSLSPDACRTPPHNVALPYHITASLDQAVSVSPNVYYQGEPVVLAEETSIAHVIGDESGTGGGVKSGTQGGAVRFIEGASSLRVNGKLLVRAGDRVSMNNGNTLGVVQSLARGAPRGIIGPDGRSSEDCNPPMPRPGPRRG